MANKTGRYENGYEKVISFQYYPLCMFLSQIIAAQYSAEITDQN